MPSAGATSSREPCAEPVDRRRRSRGDPETADYVPPPASACSYDDDDALRLTPLSVLVPPLTLPSRHRFLALSEDWKEEHDSDLMPLRILCNAAQLAKKYIAIGSAA